jgi:hypothetical protein
MLSLSLLMFMPSPGSRRHNWRIIAESLMGLVSRGLLDVINQDELAGSVAWPKL